MQDVAETQPEALDHGCDPVNDQFGAEIRVGPAPVFRQVARVSGNGGEHRGAGNAAIIRIVVFGAVAGEGSVDAAALGQHDSGFEYDSALPHVGPSVEFKCAAQARVLVHYRCIAGQETLGAKPVETSRTRDIGSAIGIARENGSQDHGRGGGVGGGRGGKYGPVGFVFEREPRSGFQVRIRVNEIAERAGIVRIDAHINGRRDEMTERDIGFPRVRRGKIITHQVDVRGTRAARPNARHLCRSVGVAGVVGGGWP